MEKRRLRLENLLHQEIAKFFKRYEELSMVTITAVNLTNDYRKLKVFYSPLSLKEDKKNKEIEELLNREKKYLRLHLGKLECIRHPPELEFIIDKTPQRVERITMLLKKIYDEK